MRLSGGVFRGRELQEPHGGSTHPMGSRERLALFNRLSSVVDFANLAVLDAYAGTGALGFEALSRGAASVTFVEQHHAAAAAIRQNISLLHVKNTTKLVEKSVAQFNANVTYDLIFIDPPYDHFLPTQFLHLASLLTAGGVLVLSHPASFDPTQPFTETLVLHSTRSYAAAHINIFLKKS